MGVADHFRNEKFEQLVENLKKKTEPMGLYLQGAQPVVPPGMEQAEDPPVFLQVVFQIGERALDPMNTEEDPERLKEMEILKQMEASFNDPTAEIRESLAKGGVLDLDDDIEDLT